MPLASFQLSHPLRSHHCRYYKVFFFVSVLRSLISKSWLMAHLQKHIPALHTSFAVLCNLHGYAHVEHRLMPAKSMIAQRDVSHCVVVDCGTKNSLLQYLHSCGLAYFSFRKARLHVPSVPSKFSQRLSRNAFSSVHERRPSWASFGFNCWVRWNLYFSLIIQFLPQLCDNFNAVMGHNKRLTASESIFGARVILLSLKTRS